MFEARKPAHSRIRANPGGRVIVVGGGVAAHGAVSGLRQAGFQGQVIVIGRETHPPYERPYLSKRYLLHEVSRQQIFLPPLEAEMRLGEDVVEIEVDPPAVRLASGERMDCWRLLLATGSRPRQLSGHEHRLSLRDLEQADRLRALLDTGQPLELVGAGFIGCEVAAVTRRRGLPVTVYEALEWPMERVLGAELGAWLAGVHRAQGVALRTGVTRLPTLGTNVLIGVGTQPNVELAEAAGLDCGDGVLVDELGRTSAPGVFAAGDCARFWSPLLEAPVRVEHYQTAHRHGQATGRAIAGAETPFDEAPWFWSDQYDLNLQYVGAAQPWDESVVRGRFGEPPFTTFFLAEGRLRAALGVNDSRVVSAVRRLMEGRVEVSAAELADPGFDLKRPARL